MLASFWCTQAADTDTVIEFLPRLQDSDNLSELILDNLLLNSRDNQWDAEE